MREAFTLYIADTTGSMAIAFLIPLVCYGVTDDWDNGYCAPVCCCRCARFYQCSSDTIQKGAESQ